MLRFVCLAESSWLTDADPRLIFRPRVRARFRPEMASGNRQAGIRAVKISFSEYKNYGGQITGGGDTKGLVYVV